MNLLLVYNPNSGKGKVKKRLEEIKSALLKVYEDVDICETQSKGYAYDYILKLEKKYDVIVAAGGDGTVTEVVNAVMHMTEKPVIGTIPAGTTNDFVRNFGIKDIDTAIEAITTLKKKKHSIYKANDVYFNYILAVGMLTDITYGAKKRLGKLSYYLTGIKKFFFAKCPKQYIVINGEKIPTKYRVFLISNSNHACGYRIKKYDKLCAASFKGNRVTACIRVMNYFFFKRCKKYLADEFVIETSEKTFNTDGERNETDGIIKVCKAGELEFLSNID